MFAYAWISQETRCADSPAVSVRFISAISIVEL